MFIVTLLRDDVSLSNGKEIHLLVLCKSVGILSNGIEILGFKGVWDIDDSTVELLSFFIFKGVFKGLVNFDLRESILLLFSLTGEFVKVIFDLLSDACFDSHYLRFIKF